MPRTGDTLQTRDQLATLEKKSTDDLAAANKQLSDAQKTIDSLTSDVSDLNGQLTTAQEARDAAQTEVGRLTGVMGMAADGDMLATGLHLQIAMKQEELNDLNEEVGMMATDDAAATGLYAMIAGKQNEIDSLMTTLGMMATDDMPATGLYKQLADAQTEAMELKEKIGMMATGDAAATGLYAKIAEAEERAETAEADKKAAEEALAALQGTVDTTDTMTAVDMAKKLNAALMGGGVEAYTNAANPAMQAMVRGMAVEVKELAASMDGVLSVKLRNKQADGSAGADLTGYTKKGDMPDMIAGWRGATLTKDNAMAVVYTDIEDTAGGRFDGRYDATLDDMRMKRYTLADTAPTDGSSKPVLWSDGRLDSGAQLTMTGTGATVKNAYPGSVHSVSGMFSCIGGDCGLLSRLSDGKIDPDSDADSAMWYFMPTDPNAMISTVVDDKYLTFGWWLDKGDGTKSYYFDAFAMGMGTKMVRTDLDTAAVTGLQGMATYEGAAAGKYTLLNASEDTAEGGHFTASAMLKANFDAATDEAGAPPNMNGLKVTGMIDNFMTGDMSRPGWQVELTSGDTAPDDPGMQNYADLETADMVMGSTKWSRGGTAMPGAGSWEAMFYGGMTNDFPDAVAGTFNASSSTGRISGAFGAMEK